MNCPAGSALLLHVFLCNRAAAESTNNLVNQVSFIRRLFILACTDSQSQLAYVESIYRIDG